MSVKQFCGYVIGIVCFLLFVCCGGSCVLGYLTEYACGTVPIAQGEGSAQGCHYSCSYSGGVLAAALWQRVCNSPLRWVVCLFLCEYVCVVTALGV